MTEGELVASSRAGSTAAFTRLVEIYQTPIYNLCYRMLGDAGEAEDAAQEAFLRAYSQLHRYDPARPFKTWLFAIASHHCIDRLRRRHVTWLGIDEEPLLTHPALVESRPGPEQMAVRREEAASVQAVLAELAPKDRSAIVMRYWYDMSYEEIARATGSTASAVKSRLHRARVTLGAVLRAAEGFGGMALGDARASQRSPETRWTTQTQWTVTPA
jgi:RNA polymerase sigma-70 factor (ECF subfamily)